MNKTKVGSVSTYLRKLRSRVTAGGTSDVPCGDCSLCCSGVYDVNHITPKEQKRLGVTSDVLSCRGEPCSFLCDDKCSVYSKRPFTCSIFDCRLFALLPVNTPEIEIQQYALRKWEFSHNTEEDYVHHLAFRLAAISAEGESFEGMLGYGMLLYKNHIEEAREILLGDGVAVKNTLLYPLEMHTLISDEIPWIPELLASPQGQNMFQFFHSSALSVGYLEIKSELDKYEKGKKRLDILMSVLTNSPYALMVKSKMGVAGCQMV